MRRVAAAAGAALLVLAAGPAAASAATVEVGKRCYAEGDELAVRGTGYTPDSNVRLTLERESGETLESSNEPIAGADGNVVGSYGIKDETGWFSGSQTRFDMTLRLADLTDPTIVATTSFIFSRWNVGVTGGRIRPTRPVRILAVGYTNAAGKPLYAHWMRNGRRVHTRRLGRLRAPCGDLRARLAQGFPFRPVRPGRYEVRFTPSRTNTLRSSIRHRAGRVARRIP